MQLVVNIDSSNFGITVEKLFEELSVDDKRDLAKQMLHKFLEEPVNMERQVREQMVINELMKQNDYNGKPTFTDENSARYSYKFKEIMRDFKSSKETMIEKTTAEMTKLFSNLVTDMVNESPECKLQAEVIQKSVEDAFPEMVQIALTNAVATQLQNATFAISQQNLLSDRVTRLTNNIRYTLNTRGMNIQDHEIPSGNW